ncbi:MAG TPA: hypothetical protein VF952_06660 [Chloroflexia bacterium]|jgi:hypothetical protein
MRSGVLGRWLYRARQFFAALGVGAKLSREDLAEARQVLGPDLYRVFAAMPSAFKRHGLSVYRKVLSAGGSDETLLQAALLHDSGKYDPVSGRYVMVLHRVAVVLLEAVQPGRAALEWLSRKRPASGLAGYLLYPFYLSKHHPRLGAKTAREHDASPELIRLIAKHQHYDATDEALRRLQAADDRS